MGTWTCAKLRGLLRAIINMDSAQIAVEMLNILEENENIISHEENSFFGSEQQVESGRNSKTEEEESYHALKVKQINITETFDKTLKHLEYTIQHMNVMSSYQLITSKRIYNRLKYFSQDAMQIMNGLNRRINAMKEKISDLENVRATLQEKMQHTGLSVENLSMRDLFDMTMTMDYELLDITLGRLNYEQLDIKKEINRVE